jgi:signal transduction histidine kinase
MSKDQTQENESKAETNKQQQIEELQAQLAREQAQRLHLEAMLSTAQQQLENLQVKLKHSAQEEIERYYELSRKIGYTLSYEELFRSVLEHLDSVIPHDVTGGILIKQKNCELFLKNKRPLAAIAQLEIEQQLLEAIATANKISASEQQFCVHNLDVEPKKSTQEPIEQLGSHFLVPIIADTETDRQTIGLLFIGKEEQKPFSEHQIRLLSAIADRASVSVKQLQILIAAEQNRIETEKMRQALAKERELSDIKTRVIRTISHEYRTPLTIIALANELLESQYDRLQAEQKLSCFKQIRGATSHLANLVNDALLINQAETEEIEFNPSEFNLIEFCERLVEEFALIASDKHQIEFTHQGDCTGTRLDRKLLRQILINLLSNAIKYSPEGGSIEFQLTCDRPIIKILIRDRGIGIPPEDCQRLFDSFHRASNVGNLPGTGLGLAIVKKCIDLHQGEITFESEVGIGTQFTLQLPFSSC